MSDNVADLILALEDERCRCLVEQRFDRLSELLSERLIHTHTRGNVDDRESYFEHVGGLIELLAVTRSDLRVMPLGDRAALLHGKQVNRARKRGEATELTIESTVTQVFEREADGQWRMVAFQATPLGAPPPALVR